MTSEFGHMLPAKAGHESSLPLKTPPGAGPKRAAREEAGSWKHARPSGSTAWLLSSALLVALGIVACLTWLWLDLQDRQLIGGLLSAQGPWVRLALHGRLLAAVTTLLLGIGWVWPRARTFHIAGAGALGVVGAWNIGNDFLVLPALAANGHCIGPLLILRDTRPIWFAIGIGEICIALILTRMPKIGRYPRGPQVGLNPLMNVDGNR